MKRKFKKNKEIEDFKANLQSSRKSGFQNRAEKEV